MLPIAPDTRLSTAMTLSSSVEEPFAEVRAEEAGAAGDDDAPADLGRHVLSARCRGG